MVISQLTTFICTTIRGVTAQQVRHSRVYEQHCEFIQASQNRNVGTPLHLESNERT